MRFNEKGLMSIADYSRQYSKIQNLLRKEQNEMFIIKSKD